MTTAAFDYTRFANGDFVTYKGKNYHIISIDFEERLFGIIQHIQGSDDHEISWVRCESCEYVSLDSKDVLSKLL